MQRHNSIPCRLTETYIQNTSKDVQETPGHKKNNFNPISHYDLQDSESIRSEQNKTTSKAFVKSLGQQKH